jgi:hypothetical protein
MNNHEINSAVQNCKTTDMTIIAGPVTVLCEGKKVTEYGVATVKVDTADAMAWNQALARKVQTAGRLTVPKGRKYAHIAACVPMTMGNGGTLITLRERLLGSDK